MQNEYSYLEVENIEINKEEKEETKEKIIIHITGQVVNEGIVELEEGARIIEAVEKAGGTTEEANLSKINLAYILEDGMKIYIPSKNDEEDEYIVNSAGINEPQNKKESLKVNINTATSDELQRLPGIGESMASKIITYRKENGKFQKIEDLKNVSGIGDIKYNNIKKYIYVK